MVPYLNISSHRNSYTIVFHRADNMRVGQSRTNTHRPMVEPDRVDGVRVVAYGGRALVAAAIFVTVTVTVNHVT